jgi:hypothetical protein
MFEWAGVSFGEEETYKLSKAIKVLCFIFKYYVRDLPHLVELLDLDFGVRSSVLNATTGLLRECLMLQRKIGLTSLTKKEEKV